MILEGRQIRTLADLMDYCEAAMHAARIRDRQLQPDAIELMNPQDMRLVELPRTGGGRILQIEVTAW